MRKIIFILLVSIISASANAQLTNTKWKGILKAQDPIDVFFSFGTDTLAIIKENDGMVLENMIFTTKDTVLTVQKINGQSGCDSDVIGKYKFVKKDNAIFVTVISDECTDRSETLDKTIWTKQ
jgi:hypothetical protein